MATSRGRDLNVHLRNLGINTRVVVRPGRKLGELTTEASNIVKSFDSSNKIAHVYFLAGYTDLTIFEKKGRYQEVVFPDTPSEATERLKEEIDKSATQILAIGAIPCFCTIIPGNIKTWNYLRKSQHKTTSLKHSDSYSKWQQNLEEAIIQSNRVIIEQNIKNNMQTPKTHETVISIRKKGKYRFQYGKLTKDGIHPSEHTKSAIAKIISKAISQNRKLLTTTKKPTNVQNLTKSHSTLSSPPRCALDSDSEIDSPKRSWKAY